MGSRLQWRKNIPRLSTASNRQAPQKDESHAMTTTESSLTADVRNGIDFKVADLSLADYGRRDIALDHGSDRYSTLLDYPCLS